MTRRMRSASTAALLLTLAGGAAGAAQPALPVSADAASAADVAVAAEARNWIERMNRALATRNYHGVYVHQRGKRRETLRIVHRVQDGKVMERLSSVDGSGRELLRNGPELTCYFPDRQIVIVERRPQEQSFIDGFPGVEARTLENYRIASTVSRSSDGRPTRLVELTPRDQYRYGYRMWIDEKSALPIKTQLCDGDGNVLEQIEFASLALPARIDDALLQPTVSDDGFRWIRHVATPARAPSLTAWQALQLPPGFHMSARADQDLPTPMSHWVFTDGVASVSVFIETNDGDGSAPPQRLGDGAQVGSAAAFSTLSDGRRITAVGEVPQVTVRYIAQSMQTAIAQSSASAAASLPAQGASAASPRGSDSPRLRAPLPSAAEPQRGGVTAPGFASPGARAPARNAP